MSKLDSGFILEVMGRHTGWLALASGIAWEHVAQAPHSILIPERILRAGLAGICQALRYWPLRWLHQKALLMPKVHHCCTISR